VPAPFWFIVVGVVRPAEQGSRITPRCPRVRRNSCLTASNSESATLQRAMRSSSMHSNLMTAKRRRPAIRTATATLFLASIATIAWSPWLSAWRAAHGQIAPLDTLTTPPIDTNPGPPLARALFFTNTGSDVKSVFWIDADNRECPLTFSKRAAGFSATGPFPRNVR
jgi:hypothetical protein